MPRTAVAAPPVDPKEELRRLLWALLFRRLQVNIRAKLPKTDDVNLVLPNREIPVKDARGVRIGVVTGWSSEGGDMYVDMLIDPQSDDGRAIRVADTKVAMVGQLDHLEIKGRA